MVDIHSTLKGMAIYKRGSKLIICGSVHQGSCRMRHLYNISLSDRPVPRGVVANDETSSSVIFVGPGPPNPKSDQVLYVGATYTQVRVQGVDGKRGSLNFPAKVYNFF